MSRAPSCHRAFTIVEVLVVLGIIGILLAILLPTIASVRKQGVMTQSMNNLKQIFTWVKLYAPENHDIIVPSQFDYRGNTYKGHVRSDITPGVGFEHQGTWTDILWSQYEIGIYPEGAGDTTGWGNNYRYDSPDTRLYQKLGGDVKNPLRSAAMNTKNAPDLPPDPDAPSMPEFGPLPFGTVGAQERGLPGYFAANDFFNANGNRYWTHTQIRAPDRSMYIVDSFYGEIIKPFCGAYDFEEVVGSGTGPSGSGASTQPTGQVDFRYPGEVALFLMLDGHVEPEGKWQDLNELEQTRKVRIRNPDTNTAPLPCP